MDFSQEKYWNKNFNDKRIVGSTNDLQSNIARTKNGKRVKKEIWNETILYFTKLLKIDKESIVLELCCGNGVIIGELSTFCKTAYGIDYSKELLGQLRSNYRNDNLLIEHNDVNFVDLKLNFFDTIIIYFSIQHFNERNTFLLIEKCIAALKVNGKLLIGDIPDLDKKWEYINKPTYHMDYFSRAVKCSPKIGYWFQKEFFLAMNSCFINTTFSIIEQPKYQINSDHCFDLLIIKNKDE